jgi:hypothetical protein
MKQDIEYAALLVAGSMPRTELHKCGGLWMPSYGHYWNPLQDDGDSRRLEIVCLNWIGRVLECPKSVTLAYAEFAGFLCSIDIAPEQYRAAVFALAVAIGKTMEGGE